MSQIVVSQGGHPEVIMENWGMTWRGWPSVTCPPSAVRPSPELCEYFEGHISTAFVSVWWSLLEGLFEEEGSSVPREDSAFCPCFVSAWLMSSRSSSFNLSCAPFPPHPHHCTLSVIFQLKQNATETIRVASLSGNWLRCSVPQGRSFTSFLLHLQHFCNIVSVFSWWRPMMP